MGAITTFFTNEITNAIVSIAYNLEEMNKELKRMNDLKEKELTAEYGGKILTYGE